MNERAFPFVPADVETFARSLHHRPGMALQAIHDYTHADGSPWWRIARYKNPETGEKMPLPFRREGAGFVPRMPEIPHGKRPLYHLHKLGQYVYDLVYLVEGEACADALEELGFIATTWPNGAQAVLAADWLPLSRRFVILWPDFDNPGFQAMREARRILEGLGATVVEIDVAKLGLEPKSDAVDWLAAFVARRGKKHLHEIPQGIEEAGLELQELPWLEDRRAAA